MISVILNFLQNIFFFICLMAGTYFTVFYLSLYAILGII